MLLLVILSKIFFNKYFYKGIYYQREGVPDRIDYELLSELYLSRLARDYFNFKTPIYEVGRYKCIDKSVCVGVTSKDLEVEFDKCIDLFDFTGLLIPTLKDLNSNETYMSLSEDAKFQMVKALLFQVVTMQYDMSGVNVLFGLKDQDVKDLILLDFGSNGLSRLGKKLKTDDIDEKINNGGRFCLGLDSKLSNFKQMFFELQYSNLISNEQLDRYLSEYGDINKQVDCIKRIGEEIKSKNCVCSTSYQDLLSYSINKLTNMLIDVYNDRLQNRRDKNEFVL